MSKFTRLVAIGAISALPVALAPSAVAQTPGAYQPYVPANQVAQDAVDNFNEGLGNRANKLPFNSLFRKASRTFTVNISAPGTYEVKFTVRLPGKKYRTLSRGTLVVPTTNTKPTGTIRMRSTTTAREFRKSSTQRKYKGRTIPVRVVTTFKATNGVTVVSTDTVRVDKK